MLKKILTFMTFCMTLMKKNKIINNKNQFILNKKKFNDNNNVIDM